MYIRLSEKKMPVGVSSEAECLGTELPSDLPQWELKYEGNQQNKLCWQSGTALKEKSFIGPTRGGRAAESSSQNETNTTVTSQGSSEEKQQENNYAQMIIRTGLKKKS